MKNPVLTIPPCIVCGNTCHLKFKKYGFDIFQCHKCKLGFVYPIPSKNQLSDLYITTNYYNSNTNLGYHADSYNNLENSLKKTYRSLPKKFPKQSYNRILDVGCAYTYFSDVAKEILNPKEIFCLDLTKEAEEATQKKGYNFIKGFIEDINIKKQHFDLIFIGDCFEHVRDPIQVTKKLSEILAPNGIIVITTVDFDSLFARFFGSDWRLLSPPEHLYYWTPNSLTQLFQKVQFEGIISNYWLYYPKTYTLQHFKKQFGFHLPFSFILPSQHIPIWSFDVMLGIFKKCL